MTKYVLQWEQKCKNTVNHTQLWFAHFNQTPTLRKLSCWTSSRWRKSRSWAILLFMSGNGKEYQLHYSISHFWDLKGDANQHILEILDFYKSAQCHLIRIMITSDEVTLCIWNNHIFFSSSGLGATNTEKMSGNIQMWDVQNVQLWATPGPQDWETWFSSNTSHW